MKISLIVLLISLTASARQYIQCASEDLRSFDRMVVNLNGENSTLFMTNGVHLPDEDRIDVLKELKFSNSDSGSTIYVAKGENVQETIILPTNIIGEYSNYFRAVLKIKSLGSTNSYEVSKNFSCFSAIYND